MDVEPFEIDTIAQHKAEEYIKRRQERFIEYIFDESGESVVYDGSVRDTIIDVLQVMDMKGFAVDENRDGFAPPQIILSRKWHHELLDEIPYDDFDVSEPMQSTKIHTAEIRADPLLDADSGIAIHPNAIVPSHPSDVERPWLVKSPKGVIEIVFDN